MKHGKNVCAMSETCEGKPADHGLMCAECRAGSNAIERRFSDDVDAASREPVARGQGGRDG